jgi:hypothetical protein
VSGRLKSVPTWQRLLERLASGDRVVSVDDIRGWDKPEFEQAVALGILREAEPAAWIMCDACPERHWSEVIWVAGGRRAFIACPEEGTVDVEPARLRQWRIDAGRMAEVVTKALDLSGSIQPISLGRLWHLGRRRLAGRFRDFFLVGGNTNDLSGDFEQLLRQDGWTSGVVFVPRANGCGAQAPSKLRVIDLCSVSQLADGTLAVDLDYIADCFEDAPIRSDYVQTITASPGTAWSEVRMVVHDDFMQITIRGKETERDYSQAGFRDPDQRLELLKLFAAARGTLDSDKIPSLLRGDTPVKTRISRLRRLLQDLIEVDGDPIEHNKRANTYACQFEIRLADHWGYPTPESATWIDFSFHELRDGRLLVSTMQRQKFRARGRRNEDGSPMHETAERVVPNGQVYSLEEMRLRTPAGKLTPEGTTFINLVRARGRLSRRGDDLIVLNLAKHLRDWTGVEEQPFQFSEGTASWTALFACSSEIRAAE